jgi:hypothetical protein
MFFGWKPGRSIESPGFMRGTSTLLAAALGLTTLACASTDVAEQAPAPRKQAKPRALDPAWRPGSMPVKVGDDHRASADEMDLEGGRGTLDQREVDTLLAEHVAELTACGEHAGAARRYLAGDVKLRFFVTSEGAVSSVLVVASNLGNFAVERCLVELGRRLKLPAPHGRKGTDFHYSLQFRPTGEAAVVDRNDAKVARDVAHLSPKLGPCGELGPAPVTAVLYIEPGGQVGSVGLASESPLDVEAASCAVEQIRSWRMPGARAKLAEDRRRVVRTSFSVNGPPPERLVKRVPRRRAR